MKSVTIHCVQQELDHFSRTAGEGICGAPIMVYKSSERYWPLCTSPLDFQSMIGKIITISEDEDIEFKTCPDCLSHPDYPLYLLGNIE